MKTLKDFAVSILILFVVFLTIYFIFFNKPETAQPDETIETRIDTLLIRDTLFIYIEKDAQIIYKDKIIYKNAEIQDTIATIDTTIVNEEPHSELHLKVKYSYYFKKFSIDTRLKFDQKIVTEEIEIIRHAEPKKLYKIVESGYLYSKKDYGVHIGAGIEYKKIGLLIIGNTNRQVGLKLSVRF